MYHELEDQKHVWSDTWFLSDDDTARAINWLHALDAYFFAKGFDTLIFHWMNALTVVVIMLKASVHVYKRVL
jgi:hypothetical protein